MDPRWRNAMVVAIVVIAVAAGVSLHQSTSSCLHQTSPLIVDQSEIPDSLDPGVTFSTPGWAAVQQVYQGLVNYANGSSTQFDGVLAKNWTESPNGLHWTFTLRTGVHFSNGDPYNAYVQWYSFYRSLLLESGPRVHPRAELLLDQLQRLRPAQLLIEPHERNGRELDPRQAT